MKKLILSLFMITMLTGCTGNSDIGQKESNVSSFTETSLSSVRVEEDEYLSLGTQKGMEYSKMVSKYFWTSWKVDEKSGFPDEDGERYNIRITGFLNEEETDGVSFEEIKKFFTEEKNITEKCFENLNQNSMGGYKEIDGKPYAVYSDGGEWGWDYSFITDYQIVDENKIVYNCKRIDYEEDKTEEFSFTLVYENGKWKLDDCTMWSGLTENYFVGTEDMYNTK